MTTEEIFQVIDRLDMELPFDEICVDGKYIDVHEMLTEIKAQLDQAEDMKSCCTCGKLCECAVWADAIDPPVHNVNDAPCDEWELG